MHRVTSFHASDVPPDQLNGILSDYLAVERARIYRKLFVTRFGVLAVVFAIFGMVWLSERAVAASVGLCLVPPAWAWAMEIRQERRLARRIATISDAATTDRSRIMDELPKSPMAMWGNQEEAPTRPPGAHPDVRHRGGSR